MKYPKYIQEIIDQPSYLPEIKKMIEKSRVKVEKLNNESEEKLRRNLF